MLINFKKLNEKAAVPTRGSVYAAGYDLYSCADCIVEAGKTIMIPTGLAIEIPEGYFGAIYARSGWASKLGLRPANCVGVIDSDYRGEIMVAMHNDSNEDRPVHCGDRMAQLVIQPYLTIEFEEVSDLSSTQRAAGGFGSTGNK